MLSAFRISPWLLKSLLEFRALRGHEVCRSTGFERVFVWSLSQHLTKDSSGLDTWMWASCLAEKTGIEIEFQGSQNCRIFRFSPCPMH